MILVLLVGMYSVEGCQQMVEVRVVDLVGVQKNDPVQGVAMSVCRKWC